MGVSKKIMSLLGELLSVRLFSLLLLVLLGPMAAATGFAPDRRKLLPRSLEPYRSVVRVIANGGVGCGVLVGPDLVLTVAHTVTNEQGAIHPLVQVEADPLTTPVLARVTHVSLPPNWTLDPASGTDWAVLRIDKPLGLRCGWAEVWQGQTALSVGSSVEFVGFGDCPQDRKTEFNGRAYVSAGTVRDIGEHVLFHDCSMWSGSSGGPLMMRQGGKTYVVAVNSADVSVEGEVLDHGFRSEYRKETANIAVPSSNWQSALEKMQAAVPPRECKSLYVRNRGQKELQVRVRYASTNNADVAAVDSPWIAVPAGKRVRVLAPEDGLTESQVFLTARDNTGARVGPKASSLFEVEGAQLGYYAFRIGQSREATAFLP
jgi:V8-like Glu-specific endopeptidase